MYSYNYEIKAFLIAFMKVSILIQVVNVFLYETYVRYKQFKICLNPYSGGKCIPIYLLNAFSLQMLSVSILIQVVNVFLLFEGEVEPTETVMSQSLFRW